MGMVVYKGGGVNTLDIWMVFLVDVTISRMYLNLLVVFFLVIVEL